MAATGTATSTEKGRRIVGAERQTLAKDLVKRYTNGESIRALAASTGRSYGFVHRVLTESGVQLRQRGGGRRREKDWNTTVRAPPEEGVSHDVAPPRTPAVDRP
jgi:predicted transcriptional regulator